MFSKTSNLIFIGAFIVGSIFFSTAAAMVFTKPGISEILLMKISDVLNPGTYSASIWNSVDQYLPLEK